MIFQRSYDYFLMSLYHIFAQRYHQVIKTQVYSKLLLTTSCYGYIVHPFRDNIDFKVAPLIQTTI